MERNDWRLHLNLLLLIFQMNQSKSEFFFQHDFFFFFFLLQKPNRIIFQKRWFFCKINIDNDNFGIFEICWKFSNFSNFLLFSKSICVFLCVWLFSNLKFKIDNRHLWIYLEITSMMPFDLNFTTFLIIFIFIYFLTKKQTKKKGKLSSTFSKVPKRISLLQMEKQKTHMVLEMKENIGVCFACWFMFVIEFCSKGLWNTVVFVCLFIIQIPFLFL